MKFRSYKSSSNKKIGWMRHVVTLLSLIIFLIGVLILGYMAWVLATSGTITRFLSGTLSFTYSVLGMGFVLFFSGMLGWVAGASEHSCVLKTYFAIAIIVIVGEVTGIVALKVLDVQMDDILLNGWAEVNEGTRNIVQDAMDCCGFYGHKEFAYTSYPIHDSCYEKSDDELSNAPQTLKQHGCGAYLQEALTEHRVVWCSLLAGLGGIQLMSAILAIHVIRKLRDKSSSSSSSSLRKLQDQHLNYAYSL